ncbi:MAG TPA: hypothetical protein VK866_01910, partial [Acidimicrobiales bacterium]|nr:hypothetical protein [Acidimicrobiales bacterium]
MPTLDLSALDDPVIGPVCRPFNLSADAAGSIHDDDTARDLGFQGGTVAANIHMDQFPATLVELFGLEWFRSGTLSLYFRQATTDRDPVMVVTERPARDHDAQIRVWLVTPDHDIVAEGTASVGDPGAPTALRARDLRPVDPSALTILRRVERGTPLMSGHDIADGPGQRRRLAAGQLVAPVAVFSEPSELGGPVASPLTLVDLLHKVPQQVLPTLIPEVVGMWGACEIRHHQPVHLDQEYAVGGCVA